MSWHRRSRTRAVCPHSILLLQLWGVLSGLLSREKALEHQIALSLKAELLLSGRRQQVLIPVPINFDGQMGEQLTDFLIPRIFILSPLKGGAGIFCVCWVHFFKNVSRQADLKYRVKFLRFPQFICKEFGMCLINISFISLPRIVTSRTNWFNFIIKQFNHQVHASINVHT